MATLNNPFVVYGYKGVEYFCDRQKETEKMISTLHYSPVIFLLAYRLRYVNNIPERDCQGETPGKWGKKRLKIFP